MFSEHDVNVLRSDASDLAAHRREKKGFVCLRDKKDGRIRLLSQAGMLETRIRQDSTAERSLQNGQRLLTPGQSPFAVACSS